MPTKNLCQNCEHYWGDLACAAFPERIPDAILTGDNDHAKKYPDQVGDFVFAPLDLDALRADSTPPQKIISPTV